ILLGAFLALLFIGSRPLMLILVMPHFMADQSGKIEFSQFFVRPPQTPLSAFMDKLTRPTRILSQDPLCRSTMSQPQKTILRPGIHDNYANSAPIYILC